MDASSPARELTAFVAQGDLRRAGEWLVARYARDVLGLCRSMVRERALAEDLAQDVFAQAFGHLRGYRAEAAPRTWLLTIARNRCIDHLRRTEREPWDDGGEESEPDTFADDAPLPAELLARRGDVDAALGELAEGERALVVLRFRHGLEYPELATVFGLREGTVRMRLSRALAKMRERLEQRELPLPAAAVAAPILAEQAAPPARAALDRAPPAPGAPPLPRGTAAPRPAGAPPAAFGARPPPPPAAAPSRAAPPALAGRAKGASFFDRLRAFFSGAPEELAPPPAPPPTPFAAALGGGEGEPSERFTEQLERLLAQL